MKEITKKAFSTFLCVTLVCLGFTGCGGLDRDSSQETVDADKTQLLVGVWDGGFRYNWLEQWADEFETIHENTEFEPGKKGVQVKVVPSKNLALEKVPSYIKGADEHVFITEQTNYYSFIAEDSVLDITDVITETLTEYGETRSIADKMSQEDNDYYGITNTDGSKSYYSLPWYTSFFGLNYDVDLFEEQNLYFAAEGYGMDGFVVGLDTPRSKGPDGKTGTGPNGEDYTLDDGLPATYDEFFKLCDRIVELGMYPITWGGGVQEYMNYFTASLVGDAVGFEQAKLNYTLDGTNATGLIKQVNADGTLMYEDPVSITNENGYLLQKQDGRYYALQFLDRLVNTRDESGKTKYYDELLCTSSGDKHTVAQARFLSSKYAKNPNVKTVAMIAEGSWWYNEATAVFNQMASTPGAGMYERRIGFMPMPKPTAAHVTEDSESVYVNTWITNVVIPSNIESNMISAAKAFVRYIHTDKCLSSFTRYANGVRPFDYELSADDEANSSYFAKQSLQIYQSSKIVNAWSSNKLVSWNLSQFVGAFNTKDYNVVVKGLAELGKDQPIGYAGLQYFNGLSSFMTESNWNTTFKNYID